MVLKLEGAKAVGDLLQRIAQRMGKVVHRIDAPRIASPVVVGMEDPIEHRVPQVHVGGGHVDLGPQHT